MITFLAFVILVFLAFVYLFVKLEYDQEESLVRLESLLESRKWEEANWETRQLITIILNRYCKGLICIRSNSVKSPLYKFTNEKLKRQRVFCPSGNDCPILSPHAFTIQELDRFPLEKLQAIDNLWTKYSQGKFGFSVQASLYQQYANSSRRSIRNLKLKPILDKDTTIEVNQVRVWYEWYWESFLLKSDAEFFLKIRWLEDYGHSRLIFLKITGWLFDPTYYSPSFPRGMLPCNLGNEGPFSTLSLLLWRKIVRGSLID
mgnify:CR=1 FL=1